MENLSLSVTPLGLLAFTIRIEVLNLCTSGEFSSIIARPDFTVRLFYVLSDAFGGANELNIWNNVVQNLVTVYSIPVIGSLLA